MPPVLLPSVGAPRPRAAEETLTGSLRRGTRAEHERLERRLLLPGSVTDDADYARLLALWAGVWAAIRRSVPPVHELATVATAAGSARDADRNALGVLSTQPAIPCRLATDPVSLWGVTYVLRGAALGNRVLHPLLRARAGADDTFRYLAGAGADVRPEWRAFCSRLDRWGAGRTPSERGDVLAAAVDTFRFVGQAADAAGWPGPPRTGHGRGSP